MTCNFYTDVICSCPVFMIIKFYVDINSFSRISYSIIITHGIVIDNFYRFKIGEEAGSRMEVSGSVTEQYLIVISPAHKSVFPEVMLKIIFDCFIDKYLFRVVKSLAN